jgi:hypothetical protein
MGGMQYGESCQQWHFRSGDDSLCSPVELHLSVVHIVSIPMRSFLKILSQFLLDHGNEHPTDSGVHKHE